MITANPSVTLHKIQATRLAFRGALFLSGASTAHSSAFEHRFMRLPCGSCELLVRLAAFADSARSARFTSISLALVTQARRVHGGRGRIRTSVARKERQIYSLLVLATHPPVRTGAIEQRRPLCISEVSKDTMALSSRCRNLPPAIKWDSSPDSKIFGRAGGGI